MLRIPVDFNAMTSDGTRVRINEVYNRDLIVDLIGGERVLLDGDDVFTEGIIEIQTDEEGNEW